MELGAIDVARLIRTLELARGWLGTVAATGERPETSDIHRCIREIEALLPVLRQSERTGA
jgi:hypothetical protein